MYINFIEGLHDWFEFISYSIGFFTGLLAVCLGIFIGVYIIMVIYEFITKYVKILR